MYLLSKVKLHIFFLVLVVVLACFLRTYKLDSIPSGFARDEASVGYNAYSILKTGRDEYGRLLPLAFEAFGDWKLPLNIYFAIPFIAVLGLNVFAVRLSVAFFGILSVIIIYFLAEELRKKYVDTSIWFSIICTFLLAVSPWHIYMSRTAFGHNVIALFFLLLGLLFFLRSLRTGKGLIVSVIFFILTLFIYTSYHIFLPLFLFGLMLIFRIKLSSIPNFHKTVLIFLIFYFFSQAILWKANVTKIPGSSMLADTNLIYSRIERKQNEHQGNIVGSKLFHNKLIAIPYQVSINYLSVFSSQFLFNKGGENLINNIEEMGNLYLLDALLFCLGIYFLFKQKNVQFAQLVLLWLFLSPLPGAFTKDAPHSTRTLELIGALFLVEAYGLAKLISGFNKRLTKMFVYTVMGLYCFGVLIFLELYFVHFPINRARYWAYGYKQIAQIVQKYPESKVVMSKIFDSPYIFMLFYTKYDPSSYQKSAMRIPATWDGFKHVKGFDRFEFVEAFDWNHVWDKANTLYFDSVENVPKNYPVTGWIRYPFGDKAFGWFQNKGDPCAILFPEKELIPVICR